MSQKTAISLASFYIFNSELGTKEGEVIAVQFPSMYPVIISTLISFVGGKEDIVLLSRWITHRHQD